MELQGFPFDLAGYIDVQAVAGVDEAGNQVEKIIDLKTSAKSPPADKAHKSMQLTAYSLAASVLDGKPISQVELHYVVDTGRKVFACDPLVSARTPEDHAHFLRVVERAAEIIEKGAFAPADPDSWACSERFCGYAARCPFFRRGVQFSVSAEKEVA